MEFRGGCEVCAQSRALGSRILWVGRWWSDGNFVQRASVALEAWSAFVVLCSPFGSAPESFRARTFVPPAAYSQRPIPFSGLCSGGLGSGVLTSVPVQPGSPGSISPSSGSGTIGIG